jgi:diguanylate cyclase (GGDEF)-like protein
VKTAALLHDIGKLAVPEHILSKPGPLTQEEFQKIRIHPQVGAEIISGVPFPYPVAPLILSHHERWDGKGYPAGLKGDEIPLGARILAVVDYFDALMSERPYHKAMSFDAAIGLLRQESGKALDPKVVDTFVDMYPALVSEADASQEPARKLTRVAPHAPTLQPAVGLVNESPARTSVFEDIALAHREIYALYEIAQAMGSSLGVADTMALISSKLSNIVPFSCCALYLYSEESESLHCRFATGVESDIVQQLTIRNGHGLTGWVARNRRPLVNARPSADFEAAGMMTQTTLLSALVCPLVFNERFIGTIAVYHTSNSVYTDDHRRLLDRISEQAAAVIYNSMVFEQTQEDSLTDPLTALPNTRFMFMHLTRELARANRLKTEVSLLVMDLDNFKEINDTYGHHIGDRALREIAAVLRTGIRPYDICIRYAGDEFIVVLSGCGGEEAERKRLELQRAVDELRFEPRPASSCRSPSALVPPSSRTTANPTKRCSQPPTADVSRQDAPQASKSRCGRRRACAIGERIERRRYQAIGDGDTLVLSRASSPVPRRSNPVAAPSRIPHERDADSDTNQTQAFNPPLVESSCNLNPRARQGHGQTDEETEASMTRETQHGASGTPNRRHS